MQIYTKILLGMVFGAVVGLTVGPQSAWLPHDLVRVQDTRGLVFRLDRDDPASAVVWPAGVPVRFEVEPADFESLAEQAGEGTATGWVRARLHFGDRLALADPDGKLRRRLGVDVGGTVAGWLQVVVRVTAGRTEFDPSPVSHVGDTILVWLRPVGTIFMRLIQMVIVPLVFASLLVGVASLGDVRKLGRVGGKTLLLYLMTTAIAVTIGLVLAEVVRPGDFVAEADRLALQARFAADAGARAGQAAAAPSAIDNIVAIVPTNPVASLSQGNMLQVIFFAVIFGIALTSMGASESRLVVTFFDKVQQAMVLVIHMVMALAPYGVAALVAEVVGTSGLSVLQALLVYSLTVLAGLLVHLVVVYGTIARLLARLPLRAFLRAARPAQLIAFSTSSSSATLPVTMECAEENLGVSNAVASFVIPLGATVNMDGTALYKGVAAVFIAQVFQMDLSVGAQLAIVLTATMASIGAAGVPGAGMVTLAMVLTATGIPAVGVALILGMDRLLDMFRTAVNVTGDLAVTAAMAATEGEQLHVLDPAEDAADPNRGFARRLQRAPRSDQGDG